jgi:hypothetical protein
VEVRRDEGVANHIGPEPCVGVSDGVDEASVGERTGQPLSRESYSSRAPTPLGRRKATRSSAPSQALGRLGVVADPGMCGSSLRGNREICRSSGALAPPDRVGKARSRSRR